MPRWLVQFPGAQGHDDFRIDDDLDLTFSGDWAIFTDNHGPSYALPAGLGVIIERVDDQQEPAPQKE